MTTSIGLESPEVFFFFSQSIIFLFSLVTLVVTTTNEMWRQRLSGREDKLQIAGMRTRNGGFEYSRILSMVVEPHAGLTLVWNILAYLIRMQSR